MRIAREIGEDLRWPSKGSLRINDPIGLGCRTQQSGKRRRGLQRGQLAGESKLTFLKGALQSVKKLPAKDHTEYFDGEKELVSACNPSPVIWGEPSPWDHAMEMGMSEQRLPPGVQNREKSDLGAEVFGIGGDLQEGLGGSPKQQAVNQSLILQG